MSYKAILLFVFIVLLLLLYKYGRSIYIPAVQKIKGKETIDSRNAQLEKVVFKRIRADLNDSGFSDYPANIAILAFKSEQRLEVYGRINESWVPIKSYPFTAMSGNLGPKLKEGDKQIPEGLYKIEYLNPNSSYYLSVKVNYPNTFDKRMAKNENRTDIGSDIFIHGKDVTIGCIPIGDRAMEEVFMLISHADRSNIPVLISPKDFRKDSDYPEISNVSWETELYDIIKKELKRYPGFAN